MKYNYQFKHINHALPELLDELLKKGEEFDSRAGATKELMHVGITLTEPWKREITLPDRKASIAAQIVETMWVLSGRNDVEGLSHYLPRAADFSDDGIEWRAGYGPRLRDYAGVDQLDYVVGVLGTNPSSRQAVASIWDPTVDTQPGKDIACNNWLSFSSRHGKLDLHVGIRSNDAMWGWSGINTFEWSALLEVVAGLSSLEVGSLHFSVTSFHLYDQHWDKAARIANNLGIYRWRDSPRFDPDKGDCWTVGLFDAAAEEWFRIESLIRYGSAEADKEVENFREPMMQSWLRVLQWYWTGAEEYLLPLEGTRLRQACKVAVKPAGQPQPEQLKLPEPEKPDLLPHLNALHAEKHAAYGDSWKRRGEPGILANIARKVDRIGTGLDTSDETQQDTAIDLVVYLAKYRLWLDDMEANPDEVEELLETVPGDIAANGSNITDDLETLFCLSLGKSTLKVETVDRMLVQSIGYARSLWR